MFHREVARMTATGYPVQMTQGVPVVTAPAEIDTTNAGQLRTILLNGRAGGTPRWWWI